MCVYIYKIFNSILVNYFMTWSSGNVKIDIMIFDIFEVMKIHDPLTLYIICSGMSLNMLRKFGQDGTCTKLLDLLG